MRDDLLEQYRGRGVGGGGGEGEKKKHAPAVWTEPVTQQ